MVIRTFFLIVALLMVACKENSIKKSIDPLPLHSKIAHVNLIDSLGTVTLSIPDRYDTFFLWVEFSDCGKRCDHQKYRFQQKSMPITKESGFFYHGEPKDSIDRFTISHSSYFPFYRVDTAKDLTAHNNFKEQWADDPTHPKIIFDTIEKINDRYFSIFEMERSDTIHSRTVVAITTIKSNYITFRYDLLKKKDDSIGRNFIKSSIDLIRTIQISKGI